MGEPCGIPAPAVLGHRRARLAAPIVGFLDGALQPHLDQMQHTPIHDAPRKRSHQFGVRNAAEVVLQVRIDNVRTSRGTDRLSRRLRSPGGRWCPGDTRTAPAGRSASKIGSSTSVAAVMHTRSRNVEIPSGRGLPLAFGMNTRGSGPDGTSLPSVLAPVPRASAPGRTPQCRQTPGRPRPAAPRFKQHRAQACARTSGR